MKILVVGIGYVGLVTAASFAEMGHHVICLDIDEERISKLKKGKLPYYEPGLGELVTRNLKEHRLVFTTKYQDAEVCFIAVSTPASEDGSANLSHVKDVAMEIGKKMKNPMVIVNKSTVPPGTARTVKSLIKEQLAKRDANVEFEVVSNPEFLKEGTAIQDCMKPERIIIGSDSESATTMLKGLYSSFMLNHDRIIVMDVLSAEMTKYAANAMLATRISFMNELSHLCEEVGADIRKVRVGIGSDSRIGYDFLYAGVGYGGSCFPKDIRAMRALARVKNCDAPLFEAIEVANANQKQRFLKKIENRFEQYGGLKDKSVAIWGLSFKPNTDDMREAPSLAIINFLLDQQVRVKLYDPIAMENAHSVLPDCDYIKFCDSEYEAAQDVDAIILVTEWKQFRFVDLEKVKKDMPGKLFFDGRNQYQAEEMLKRGFDYHAIGVPRLPTELLKDLLALSKNKAQYEA